MTLNIPDNYACILTPGKWYLLHNRYERTDNIHLDTFHWRDDQGEVQEFDPNSDMTFGEFRREMKAEWKAYLGQMGEQF